MKKFIGFALALMMFGCDFGTESKKEVPIPKDTTKTIIRKTIVQNDTNINVSYSMNISGKVSEKNSSGNTIGGFSAIVCLENSGKCTKTNSKGQYSFSTPKTSSIAGRMFAESDTAQTPEVIEVPTNIPDTVTTVDTTIVQDTIIQNDSVIIVDSLDIVETISIDGDTANTDTVIVYKNSKILYEIPVTSWKEILPEKYIVQRNISGKIVYNGYNNELKQIEAVYWNNDSIALVIPLEISNNKLSYSGFVYQAYNDSSFQYALKINNMFIRAIDTTDSIFAISNVETYSERTGDLNNVFEDLILGSLRKYPKTNILVTIKDGDSVSKIISNNISETPWILPVDINKVFARNLWNIVSEVDTFPTWYETKYELSNFDTTALKNLDDKNVDSVYITFNSNKDTTVNVRLYWLEKNVDINIKTGKNVYGFKWDSKIFSNNKISITIPCIVSDISLLVKFKFPIQ